MPNQPTIPPAVGRLLAGLRAFRATYYEQRPEPLRKLVDSGQHPEVLVIACSDSRVDPAILTNAEPGDLFVVRNVANLVPPYETGGRFHGVSAALEFAILNLRVKHLVVMGHSGCGGIKAALDQTAARETEAHFISKWMSMLDEARLSVLAAYQMRPLAERMRALEMEGIRASLKNLRTFPCVQALEAKGRIELHGAHFDIASGTLSVLNHQSGKFYAL